MIEDPKSSMKWNYWHYKKESISIKISHYRGILVWGLHIMKWPTPENHQPLVLSSQEHSQWSKNKQTKSSPSYKLTYGPKTVSIVSGEGHVLQRALTGVNVLYLGILAMLLISQAPWEHMTRRNRLTFVDKMIRPFTILVCVCVESAAFKNL